VNKSVNVFSALQRAIMASSVRLTVRHTGGSVKNGWS